MDTDNQELLRERLIIFTRYPEPGKTKTRMIPALGASGAAALQRQMTEHTMSETRELKAWRSLSVEVHFNGGSQQLMQEWLGSEFVYRKQREGDLGIRMTAAFEASFAAGMTRVVIIGTDCPDLNAKLMSQALQALAEHDLVLGPARDGGYYLIGLRRLFPELFRGISWGTSEVRQKTLEIAKNLNLEIAQLSPLSDVDRPEDLWVVSNFNWSRFN
ncbi:MAG: glycosyltransferase [Symploca sp. SIO3C6]|uniref:Glycosyltransferase n=1 Tax=Symploca sp. SIO1C4 TaxID=2607765 RepID=A0A6B3NLD8_9CYAN|nr:glycosyltransferase [Symploca sp. SIO3C6]NER30018.1 glycosyltransferase [Symploca sp. SIO1C4]NET06108.1 glycosyltransferase [Symploca sp. SIO2B6]NET52803.1 glycosyltransferase [Merismopedia sp. SIO2A8]